MEQSGSTRHCVDGVTVVEKWTTAKNFRTAQIIGRLDYTEPCLGQVEVYSVGYVKISPWA